MEYIQATKDEPPDAPCIFCRIGDGEESGRVLAREDLAYVVLNKYPYSPGHVLVIPSRHVGDLGDVVEDENPALQRLLQRSVKALREEFAPHGFNIGDEPGARGRRRRSRPSALARRASVERGHELHAGRWPDARAS